MTDISKSFTCKMAAKIKWHNIYMELNYVTVGLRIEHSVDDGATLVVFSEKTCMYSANLFFYKSAQFSLHSALLTLPTFLHEIYLQASATV